MGLFDRLFGKKEETEKVLPSSEEVTESNEVEETVKEEPVATLNDKEEQKIADMEAYYQELKARIAATHQVTQEEPSEEPLVEEIGTSETYEDQAPVEESPVVFEPAQTQETPEEASPVADETETEPLEEVKSEAEETENGEEGGFNYDRPEQLIEALGMTVEEESMLSNSLYNELKEKMAERKQIPVYQIELAMTHVKDVQVNYDYLTELVENLLNYVHDGEEEKAQETREKIYDFTKSMDDRAYAKEINNAADAIVKGHYPAAGTELTYPVKLSKSDDIIRAANEVVLGDQIFNFRLQWGIVDVVSNEELQALIAGHTYGRNDLDSEGKLGKIKRAGAKEYEAKAQDKAIRSLKKVEYRNQLDLAIYKLADSMVEP